MNEQVYLAADFGASNGRLLAGKFDGTRLELETIHRFENVPVQIGSRLFWDLGRLWIELREGLRKAGAQYRAQAISLGVDTWGVDFALLDPDGELQVEPRHYRDPHTVGVLDRAFRVVPRAEIFAQTGLQFLPFNSLYQLWEMRQDDPDLIDRAGRLLMMPDLFHLFLTGRQSNEYTNATTTQMFNPVSGSWSDELVQRFGLPRHIFGEISPPGTKLGKVQNWLIKENGLANVEVVLPGTHDTASAVAAVPTTAPASERPTWCYLSSGTWSLLGAELSAPVINARCLELNFTNEGGIAGTTRLLKNIAGLWLIQECRRAWQEAGREFSWEELNARAEAAEPFVSRIDPDHDDFLAPADMPEAIRTYCRRTAQPEPRDEGSLIRCALESLAARYRQVLGWLEELAGSRFEVIHVVGGGSQNALLCRMTADACNRPVVAGPVEATALGNVLVQMIAAGAIGSLAEGRELIARSFPLTRYEPRADERWERV